jgi:hypothetical protein
MSSAIRRLSSPAFRDDVWGVVVFAARENVRSLCRTLNAVSTAASLCPASTVIDVLVNGNDELATTLSNELQSRSPRVCPLGGKSQSIRVWSIPVADKANAWNSYVHSIWNGEGVSFFVDGYARPHPLALNNLGVAVIESDFALGGTGVPTCGRSAPALAASMKKNGGFHGNLCCIGGATLSELKLRGIRIPLGLYRTDALMGALLSFALDPSRHEWDHSRIAVVGEATWDVDPKHWWSIKDIRSQLARLFRQHRGALENEAVKYLLAIRREPPETLPGNAKALLLKWLELDPQGCSQARVSFLRQREWVRAMNQSVASNTESGKLLREFPVVGVEAQN